MRQSPTCQAVSDPAFTDYLAGAADGLGLTPAAVLEAAEQGHPGRQIARAHLRATARAVQRGRSAFVRSVLADALAAAAPDGDE